MRFVKVPDSLPLPSAYLRAGLPRPTQAVASYRTHGAHNAVGSESEVGDFLTSGAGVGASGPQSLSVMDGAGAPSAVVWTPSAQFLTYPAQLKFLSGEVANVSRSVSGVLHIEHATCVPQESAPKPAPVDLDTARIVTVDLSVLLAPLDPAKFEINDAMWVSSALAIELALTTGEDPWPNGTMYRYTKPFEWPWSTPVPIDDLVLYIYRNLALNAHPSLRTNAMLDRTDLLCAATAIAYDTPMYTTKPEAYKGLKNGLKVLKYGPIRNKGALVGGPGGAQASPAGPARRLPTASPESAPAAPPAVPAAPVQRQSGAQELRRAYDDGEEFDTSVDEMLTRAMDDPDGLASTLCDIFDDHDHNAAPTWRIALLERAGRLAPALSTVQDGHRDLLTAVSSLVNAGRSPGADPALVRQSAAALAAYGTWGRWPEDIITEVLVGITDREPDDLAWYRTFIRIAGASEGVVDAEMDAVLNGRTEPSLEHLEKLRLANP